MGPNISLNFHRRAIRCSQQRPIGARGVLASVYTNASINLVYRIRLGTCGEQLVLTFPYGGFNLQVVSAHLAQSDRSLEEYKQSVHDLNNVIGSRRPGLQLVISVGAMGGLWDRSIQVFLRSC